MTITFKVCDVMEEDIDLKLIKDFKLEEFIKREIGSNKEKTRAGLYYNENFGRLIKEGKTDYEAYNILDEQLIEIENKRKELINQQYEKVIVLKSSLIDDGSLKNIGYSEFCLDSDVNTNSFVYAAWNAYNKHHHLVIRPDNIWMAIMTQFSFYISKNEEELRDKIVDFDNGKRNIRIYTKYPILEAPFDKLTLEMVDQISANIKDPSIRDWVIPSFSTTTKSDKVAFAAVLMSTMKKYFNYEIDTLCGLPKVTLEGTTEDYINLKERVSNLVTFNNKDNHMNKWLYYLLPIMDKLIESINGNPDTDWWNKIVNHNSQSGGGYISGWLSSFCVFTSDGEFKDEASSKFDDIYEEYDNEDNTTTKLETSITDKPKPIWPCVEETEIPNGFVSTPVLLIDADGTQYNSKLYSGHLATKIQDKTKIIPSIDWYIVAN